MTREFDKNYYYKLEVEAVPTSQGLLQSLKD